MEPLPLPSSPAAATGAAPPGGARGPDGGDAGAGKDREQIRLRRVAQEFESLLVATLLKSLRATVPQSGLIEEKGALAQYRQLHDDELGRLAARSGRGFGIADLIVRQYAGEAMPPPIGGEADEPWPVAPGPPPRGTTAPVGPAARARALDAYRRQAAAALPRAAGGAGSPSAAGGAEAPAGLAALQQAAARMGGAVADSLQRFGPEIASAARSTGVDPALLLAVMVNESGGDPQARSHKGALGLMQLMPGTAREVGVREPWQPAENIMGGARYLSRMLARFGQRLDLALAGYNAGPGAVERSAGRLPPFRETQQYVRKVTALYERLRGGTGTDLDRVGRNPGR